MKSLTDEEVEIFNERVPGLGDVLQRIVNNNLHALESNVQDGEGLKRDGGRLIGVDLLELAAREPVDLDASKASLGESGQAARADHQHKIQVSAPSRGIGGGNRDGRASALARSDHDHALREKGGSEMSLGLIPDRNVLQRQGSAIVGIPLFSRHEPAMVSKSDADAGRSEDLARADHKHDVSTGVPSIIEIGDEIAEGDSTALARADHKHALPEPEVAQDIGAEDSQPGEAPTPARADHEHRVKTAIPVASGQGNKEGKSAALARADHTHALQEGGGSELSLGSISEGQALARQGSKLVGAEIALLSKKVPTALGAGGYTPGNSKDAARSDHAHQIVVGSPVSIGTGNVEGEADELARADHGHALMLEGGAEVTFGVVQDGKVLKRAGGKLVGADVVELAPTEMPPSSSDAGFTFGGRSHLASRADHKHEIGTGKPKALLVGEDNAPGSETALARADHRHALPPPEAPAPVGKQTAHPGTSKKVARSDHRHNVATAAPARGVGSGNSEGESAALARADHDHALRTGSVDLTIGDINDGDIVRRVGSALVGDRAGDVFGAGSCKAGTVPSLDASGRKLQPSSIHVDEEGRVSVSSLTADVLNALRALIVDKQLSVGGISTLAGPVSMGPGVHEDRGSFAAAVHGKVKGDGLMVKADGTILDVRSMAGIPVLVVRSNGKVQASELHSAGNVEAKSFTTGGKPIPGAVFGAHYQVLTRKLPIAKTGERPFGEVLSGNTGELERGLYRIGWQVKAEGAVGLHLTIGDTEVLPSGSDREVGFEHITLDAGSKPIKLLFQHRGSGSAKIEFAQIELWRVQ